MEKDHTSWMQQTPLPNQAQLIEHGVPIVISIDKDAVVSAGKIRERIEAVALIDRHPRIAGVLENKVRVEAGIDDRMRNIRQLQNFICAEAGAGPDLAKILPIMLSCQRHDPIPYKVLHMS
jgi:hypothetical protein